MNDPENVANTAKFTYPLMLRASDRPGINDIFSLIQLHV